MKLGVLPERLAAADAVVFLDVSTPPVHDDRPAVVVAQQCEDDLLARA